MAHLGERSRAGLTCGDRLHGSGFGKWILRAWSAEGDPNLMGGRPETVQPGRLEGNRTDDGTSILEGG